MIQPAYEKFAQANGGGQLLDDVCLPRTAVPEFCDRTVLLNRTVLAYGPTVETFTQANLEKTFGGVLRHFVLSESDGGKPHALDVITDDERAVIFRDGKPATHEPTPDDRDRG